MLCPFEEAGRLRTRLAGARRLVVDLSAGWAGLRVRDEACSCAASPTSTSTRLPAAGLVAHVRGILIRTSDETFRLYFPQEYGGLRRRGP